jgi:hypothetical protein
MTRRYVKGFTVFACSTLMTISYTSAQPAPTCDAGSAIWSATQKDIHWTLVEDAGAIKCVQDSWKNLGGLTQSATTFIA